MRNAVLAIILVAPLLIPLPSYASMLTFEDILGGSVQNAYGDVLNYKGFNFTLNLDWVDVVGSLNPYGAHTGDFGLLNNNWGIGIITEETGADFTFDGLWAKKWGTDIESGGTDSLFGTLEGYNNGSLVWSVATGLNGSYEYYAAQSGLIDELRLGFGDHFLVDDIALNQVSSVPIPAASLLFGSGLMVLLGFRHRGNKKA